MPLSALLRINPAIRISPLLAFLAILYANSAVGSLDSYPLALTSAGTSTLFLVAPVCAAYAAWEGGRLLRSGWTTHPHTRPPLVIALGAAMPILAVGLTSITAAIIAQLLKAGAPIPDFRIVAMACAVIVAHTLLGFAVGTRIAPVVAVPFVFLVDYTWMVMPLALEPLWLRHLNGAWFTCCEIYTDLAPQALMGALVVAGGMAGTGLLLLRPSGRTGHIVLALGPAILAFYSGGWLVYGLGPDPVTTRTTTLVCTSDPAQVCVWPEHRERLQEVAMLAFDAAKQWHELGIPVPDVFSERSNLSLTERSFGFSLEADQDDIRHSLAYSMLPPWPLCALDARQAYPGAEAEAYLLAWLDTTAGVAPLKLAKRFEPQVLKIVAEVLALPPERQRIWFNRNLAALRACNVAPQLESQL